MKLTLLKTIFKRKQKKIEDNSIDSQFAKYYIWKIDANVELSRLDGSVIDQWFCALQREQESKKPNFDYLDRKYENFIKYGKNKFLILE
jgi:hypothetical protein